MRTIILIVMIPAATLSQSLVADSNLSLIAHATLPRARAVEVSGALAYVATDYALEVYNVTDPFSPVHVGHLPLNAIPNDVAVSDGLAVLACGNDGVLIADISQPDNPVLLSSARPTGYCTSASIEGQRAFALLDGWWSNAVVHAFSLDDPLSPLPLGESALPAHGPIGANSLSSYAVQPDSTYCYVSVGDSAFVLSMGTADTLVLCAGHDWRASALEYASGVIWASGSSPIDIVARNVVADPVNPPLLGAFDVPGASGFDAVAVESGHAYLAAGDLLATVNTANPSAMFLEDTIRSGHYIRQLSAEGPALATAGSGEGMFLLSLSNPVHPTPAAAILAVKRRYVSCATVPPYWFVAGYDGLWQSTVAPIVRAQRDPSFGITLVDMGETANVVRSSGDTLFAAGCGPDADELRKYVVLASGNFALLASEEIGYVSDFTVDGDYIYMLTDTSFTVFLRDSLTGSGSAIGNLAFDGELLALSVWGDRVYLTSPCSRGALVDISNPRLPQWAFEPDFGFPIGPGHFAGVLHDGYTYGTRNGNLSSGTDFEFVVYSSAEDTLVQVGSIVLPGIARRVVISDTIAFVASLYDGATLLSVANPSQPRVLARWDNPGQGAVHDLAATDSFIFVANGVDVALLQYPSIVGVSEPTIDLPTSFALHPNYPNPFNPSTTLSFDLPQAGDVRLDVFDVLGRTVDVVFDGALSAGTHKFEWNAGGLSSGVYLVRATSGVMTATGKIVLLK